MSDLISRKKLLEQIKADSEGQEGQYGDEWHFINTINAIPTAKPKEYVKDGTLTVQMPTIKEAKAIDKIVVYADTYKQEYYMPLPKVGKWEECKVVDIEDTTITEVQSAFCPICRKYHTTPYMYYFDYFNYCPNCGAKMERSER